MGYCQFERTNISFNYVTPYDNNAIILVGIPAYIHKKFVAILHYIYVASCIFMDSNEAMGFLLQQCFNEKLQSGR